jgi:uncharacterized protein (DUF1499 family)
MKIILYLITAAAVLYAGLFTFLSIDSRKVRETGLVNGRLRPCPGTPNCVLSEVRDGPSYIEPFPFAGNPVEEWAKMKAAVLRLGGRVEKETDDYLWATCRTDFWHFVDDLEFRLDAKNKVIHVRSASRVGKGDMGMNRKRVEKLRALLTRNTQ